jgi:hypothetical protein
MNSYVDDSLLSIGTLWAPDRNVMRQMTISTEKAVRFFITSVFIYYVVYVDLILITYTHAVDKNSLYRSSDLEKLHCWCPLYFNQLGSYSD